MSLNLDPMRCEKCGGDLESDDAVSVIEGVCYLCRRESAGSANNASDRAASPRRVPPPKATASRRVPNARQKAVNPPSSVAPKPDAGTGTKKPVLPLNTPASLISGTLPTKEETPVSRPARRGPAPLPKTEAKKEAFVQFERYHKNSEWDDAAANDDKDVFGAQGRFVPPSVPGAKSPTVARRRRRDLLVGVVAGLVVTAFITHYLITQEETSKPLALMQETPASPPITLTVEPAWASVTLNDQPIGPLDEFGQIRFSLAEFEEDFAVVEISADGYDTDRKPLSAYGGAQDVTVELRRKPYEVAVASEPSGAQVWVDGRLLGLTPTTLTMPPVETASLVLKRLGYLDASQELVPPERSNYLEVELALLPAGPTIRVESDPPGAAISLGGRPQGVTPLTLALDSSYLDGELALTASLDGYRDATVNAVLPALAGQDPVQAHVVMSPMVVEVAFQTEPPGGHVTLNGEDLGVAPVVATFSPADVGRSVVVQAVLPGSHHGTREITVPPIGETVEMTIPMSFNAQRMVFMLSCPPELLSDGVMLKEEMVELIHRLESNQQFAVLMGTHDGIESWPMQLGTKAATPEQKIRAYDVVRSARLGGAVDLGAMMRAAEIFEPTTVWVFTAGELDREGLEEYAEGAGDQEVTIHVVRASPGPDDAWLTEWLAAYQGSLSTLGEAPAPALAMDGDPAEE